MSGLVAVLSQADGLTLDLLAKTTGAGALALGLIAFLRGWIVPRFLYDVQKDRADHMEERAFKATDALAIAVETADKLQKENAELREDVARLKQQRTPTP